MTSSDAPEAADIGQRDEQRMGVAVLPERAHGLVARDRAGAQLAEQIGLALDDGAMRLFRRV